MTQLKLAELSHISDHTIRAYENERAEPKFALAVALADALEVDIEYLIPEYWHIKKEN
jgi:DNA-binding XRE family transcriptional regulator